MASTYRKIYSNRFLQLWLCCWFVSAAAAMEAPGSSRLRAKIPRIGRRGSGFVADFDDFEPGAFSDGSLGFFHKSLKAIPRLGRRQNYLPADHEDSFPVEDSDVLQLSDFSQVEKSDNVDFTKAIEGNTDATQAEADLAKLFRIWQRKALKHALMQ